MVLEWPPVRPGTWRNRKGLGVSLGMRLGTRTGS